MVAAHSTQFPQFRITANQRLKSSFRYWFWGSIAAAALLHFALFLLTPQLSIADWGRPAAVVDVLPPVHEYRIPPPPEELPRPQVPTMGAVTLADDITVPEVSDLFRSRPDLPPPPPPAGRAGDEAMPFTPYTVAPELRAAQRAELQRYLERNYPPALRDAGVQARVVLWVFISEQGQVQNTRVVESSGYPAFDQLAQDALHSVRFAPAINRDQRVPVWIQLPIQFQVR